MCLELYCKNPHVLDPLRKYLILPSNKTIRYKKDGNHGNGLLIKNYAGYIILEV